MYVLFNTSLCCQKLFFSDELFQAQQALHHTRWASEDVVSVLMMESDSSAAGPSQTIVPNINHQITSQTAQHLKAITNGIGTTVCRNEFFQSPPSTESVSSGSVMMADQRQQNCVTNDVPNNGPVENTGLFGYPEYKH